MAASDNSILVDTSGGAITLTLPAPTNGRVLKIKDSTGNAGTNNITILPNASELIDGASSLILSSGFRSIDLISNGTDWFIDADYSTVTTSGTVTSVALALPVSVFTVSGSPVTTSGTLTGSFATQTANTIFAGPTTGGAAVPAFRALVAADIPSTLNSTTFSTTATAGAFISSTANVATAGAVRLANADAIEFRNSGNSANILLAPGSTDSFISYAGSDLVNVGSAQTITGVKTFNANTLIAQSTASQATIGAVGNSAQHQINGGLRITTNTVSTNYSIV